MLVHPNAVVQLSVREDDEEVFLLNIHTKKRFDLTQQLSGTGRGTQALSIVKKYVDLVGKKFSVVAVTDHGLPFWLTIAWLDAQPVLIELEGKLYSDHRGFVYYPDACRESKVSSVGFVGALPIRSFFGWGE